MLKFLRLRKKKPRVRRSRGVLTLIGVLLLTSAGIRLATDAGQVWALDFDEEYQEMVQANTGASALMSPELHDDVAALLESLQKREERVKSREKDILIRQRTVEVAEEQILARLEEMKAAEDSLRKMVTLASTAAEEDLASLTEVYANMKPKQAAALFEKMDPSFAAGFLGRMPSDAAAKIMAGLPPDKAYIISVQLAGRNAKSPQD